MPEAFDPGLPNERFPFPAYPNGWARVGLSEELPVGAVQAIRYFGRDLVLFRSESGEARVLDAYCRHLGAHLGHGGKVDGEGLRCPFHAWLWNGYGKCIDIPYAKKIPAKAEIHSWQTCERNGFIFIWYHGDGAAADEVVPELPEHEDPEWSAYFRLRWKIRGRGYDMGENTVDDVHFHYLHGAASLPKSDQGDILGSKSTRSKMEMESPLGKVDATIENSSVPGMGIVYLRGICDTVIVITSAPIDGEYVDQMFSYKQRTGGDEKTERIGKAFLRDLEKQMNEDIVCFENKRYFVNPLLCEGDGPIGDYRRRTRKRYSGEFPAAGDAEAWDTRAGVHPHTLSRAKEPGFSEREFEELSSFLRSTFKVRRVVREDFAAQERTRFELLGREDALKHVLLFERDCLWRNEVTELRAYFARPVVRQQIEAAGDAPFEVRLAALR
jgi:3-ketosteroid 9alpha-monooxygenase subunit A